MATKWGVPALLRTRHSHSSMGHCVRSRQRAHDGNGDWPIFEKVVFEYLRVPVVGTEHFAVGAPGQLLSRRRLLQAAAAGALALAGAGRSVGDHGVGPAAIDWTALAEKLTGRLVLAGKTTYAVDLQLYDPQFDGSRPAAIAYCANADDVARCVTFARSHHLPLAARSGGHSYAGYSTTTGLVVDVSLMSDAAVNADVAIVGAGARLIDMYSELAREGRSVPAGSCPTVGIAGLALGGGIGVMDRLHGLTCDHTVGLEVVTAAGEVVRADPHTNPDLYWACRGGGGGNFGIVTEFQFSTFPTTELALFSATWPWSAVADLLPAWLEWAPNSPDPLWSNCLLQTVPGAVAPTVMVGGVWSGTLADANAQLQALEKLAGRALSQVSGANGFADAMYIEAGCAGLSQAACHIAGRYPGGTLPRVQRILRSDILNEPLSDKGITAVVSGIAQRHDEGGPGDVIFDSWGGAINRVAPEATAFVHRKAIASAQYEVAFPPGVTAGPLLAGKKWMDGWYRSLRPYVSGEAYQNYIDPDLPDWEHAYYGANLAHLQRVKAEWDPDDVFQFAQGIPLPERS
jgi:FAD binding domain/Berberine and berberine like